MSLYISLFRFALCPFLLASFNFSPVLAEELRVGMSRIDITPENPVAMSGYASRTGLSEGVHDPLFARAVAFEREGERLVLVSTDVIGFYGGSAEVFRRTLLEECQLEPGRLFLSAIHTHSGPVLSFDAAKGHSNNVAYTRLLQRRLVEVVKAAMKGAEPAQLGFGSGSSPIAVNRREIIRDQAGSTRVVLGRNPSAHIDREVQVIKVEQLPGTKPAAVLFGYAMHSTSLGPRNYTISGDVHGLAEQFVERHLGEGMIAAGFAGASGDIDPWYRVLPGFKKDQGWMPETVSMGTLLGQEVVYILDRIQKTAASGPIKALFKTVELPRRTSENSGANAAPCLFNLTVARVGEIAFVGLGGEVFNEIGMAIKASSPFPFTLVITHCNGAGGYLVTEASFAEGGYEVQSTPFAPGAAAILLRHISELLAEIR
jgi:neutral ceramidase